MAGGGGMGKDSQFYHELPFDGYGGFIAVAARKLNQIHDEGQLGALWT